MSQGLIELLLQELFYHKRKCMFMNFEEITQTSDLHNFGNLYKLFQK